MSKVSEGATRWLNTIERLGNRLPHPTLIFVYLCLFVVLLSALMTALQVSAVHPLTGATVTSKNLVSSEGLRWWLTHAVTNFTHFAPVGTVLVAILGIGIADRSGLLAAVLRSVVEKASGRGLTFAVVLAGVLSSLAADTGYVVLIPLAAMAFKSAGRAPLLGIFAAFAGVSGGYSANLLIGPLDAMLAGISTEAARVVAPAYQVNATGNYYFIVVSTLLVALVGTWVTERIVAKRFESAENLSGGSTDAVAGGDPAARTKGLRAVGVFTALFVLLLLWATVPEVGVLRNPETGSLLKSPFISGIVVLIALYAGLAGCVFGVVSGEFARSSDVVEGMEAAMATMAGYLVLMFFAAQFVNAFSWSQLGTIAAIRGAEGLQWLNPSAGTLLVLFVLLAALINLLIGSASAKWALIAPIFVPMFLLVGISPEAAQMAYRVGDSSTNIITPLMPYFGVVVAFMQRYEPKAGIGTMMAAMLPYSIALLVGWTLLLLVWVLADLPLGPGASMFVELAQ